MLENVSFNVEIAPYIHDWFPFCFQELVGNAADQRNWRGIIIALIVIVAVLGLIVTAIVLVTPSKLLSLI